MAGGEHGVPPSARHGICCRNSATPAGRRLTCSLAHCHRSWLRLPTVVGHLASGTGDTGRRLRLASPQEAPADLLVACRLAAALPPTHPLAAEPTARRRFAASGAHWTRERSRTRCPHRPWTSKPCPTLYVRLWLITAVGVPDDRSAISWSYMIVACGHQLIPLRTALPVMP